MQPPSQLASIRTFFDVLGVPRDASANQIEVAWHGHVVDAEGRYDRVPKEIRSAYQLLRDAPNRALYLDLLRCCETGALITQPPNARTKFAGFCDRCDLRVYPVPRVPNTYAVRAPWQDPPDWVEQRPPLTTWLGRVLEYVIRQFILGGVFRGKGWLARGGLALIYVAILAALLVGGAHVSGLWDNYQHHRAVAAQRAFEREVRHEHSRLAEHLADLKRTGAAVSSQFHDATGITIEEALRGASAWTADLSWKIRTDDEFAELVSEVLRAWPKPADYQAIENELAQAAAAITSGHYAAAHPENLRLLGAQVHARIEQLKAQSQNVARIRKALRAAPRSDP